KIAVKCLVEQGVTDIFGYPGASIIDLLDEVASEKKLKLYVNTHEESCAFAADGYARASGRPGVCIATSGPGATNLVTGIANAYMDSIPMVAITGNVPLSMLGTDAFQEIDIAGITMPITKHNFIVKSVDQLADTLRMAFRIATTGRMGPVLVDIPSDIFRHGAKFVKASGLPEEKEPELPNIKAVAELINVSSSPAVCVGGGVIASGASGSVAKLVGTLDCPVVSTAMGIGAFDQNDPRYRGLVGMNIQGDASGVLMNSDLLIAIGVRFSDRMIGSIRANPALKVVHIDIDDAEIDKNLQPCGSLVGDARFVLDKLLPLLKQRKRKSYSKTENGGENAYELIGDAFEDAVFTTEVGLHQVEACRGLRISRPRGFITSGGLGAMGYGLPAAIGASIANGRGRTVNIAGDGSFNMNMQELGTAVKYGLPIVEIIISNRSLGMIENLQNRDLEGRVNYCDLPKTDYSAIASAFGVSYYSASDLDELKTALSAAKKNSGAVLIEYRTKGLI
ncbi:MAG: thiamine pyrophosphate-binding protein, partial [Clostridia bacterium]|nr:thiamine pyrophosphate-binding protein [Clostridia bacterium]